MSPRTATEFFDRAANGRCRYSSGSRTGPEHVGRDATTDRAHRRRIRPWPAASNASTQLWSVRDIVAHLRACAVVWGRSMERMIGEDHPTIRYVSPRGWIKRSDFLSQDFEILLAAFTAERTALLEALRPLDAPGWRRGAAFTGTSLGKQATVLSYAQRMADHVVGHIEQLRRTLLG
ncbi:MAG: DinB family protein [Gemmatimonadetes bacterium]|nr:DinB family protein [Gemmatimonadota bacterium]